MLLIVRGNL